MRDAYFIKIFGENEVYDLLEELLLLYIIGKTIDIGYSHFGDIIEISFLFIYLQRIT